LSPTSDEVTSGPMWKPDAGGTDDERLSGEVGRERLGQP
jgi:hypothetical protein